MSKPPQPDNTQQSSRSAPDWERIELDYRAGIKSLREIAVGTGVSHVTISKHAKRNGWVRDLSAKIAAKADELINKASVNKPINTASAVSEREMVDGVATQRADIQLSHRRDIARARNITNALLQELEQCTGTESVELLQQLGDMLRNPDDKGADKLNDLYQAIISLPERSKTMKVLAESLQKVVDMERQAFGMDKEQEKAADPLTALLMRISGGSASSFVPVQHDPEAEPPPAMNSLQPQQEPADD